DRRRRQGLGRRPPRRHGAQALLRQLEAAPARARLPVHDLVRRRRTRDDDLVRRASRAADRRRRQGQDDRLADQASSARQAMNRDRFLHVEGDRLVDAAGRTVVLRGYNIGGFLNMENFLTGFPSTESLQRSAMLRAMGESRYCLFFDRFLEVFFADDDARYLRSLGMNHVRVPFNYLHFEDDDRPFELKEGGFTLLDCVVDVCERNDLYAILDLHALPGCQNMDWHSNNPTHHAGFWEHRHFQDRAVHLWERLADRYKGRVAIAGYNLMNEPGDATGARIKPFYDRCVAAVRAIDPDHVIFLDGNRYGTEFTPFEGAEVYPNTVYAAHDYKTPGMVFGGPYPGVTRGIHVDRAHVEETFLKRTEFMRKT